MASIEEVTRRLEDAGLEVDRTGDTLNVQRGSGPAAAKSNVDPVPFLETTSEDDDGRRLAGFVAGIDHVLLEPGDSDASEWSFKQSAGRLAASLEVESFSAGVEAATGSPAWTRPFADNLTFAFLIELDSGIRVLTHRQFERWSETADRVFEAARSMLFHKAEQTEPTPLEGTESVEQFYVGDGYDAARCLVLDDLLFAEFDASSRFGMPTRDDLWFVRKGTDEATRALRSAVERRFETADEPLSNQLYRFERSRPVPAD